MQLEFEAGDNKEYKVDGILNSAVHAKELTTGQLPRLYYLVLWKGYLEEENTRSLHWQSITFKVLSPLTIKTIQKKHQRPLFPSMRLHQWLGPRERQQIKAGLLGL